MSRFKKLIKKKQTAAALSKHPLMNADAQVQKDYLQGLVFVAVEDENFSEEEKAYLKLLMQYIEMDESQLESMEAFANAPDEDELMAFMERLKALDEALRINFMVEVILLAFKDGSYDEKEQAIFADYIEMLNLQDHANTIEQLGKAIANQDMDMALALYTAKKETVEPLQYLFELAEMDLQDELEELYQWQWVKWDFSAGSVKNDNLVATKPVTVRQIAVFMNALQLAGYVEQLPNSQRFEHKDEDGKFTPLIADLSISNIQFEEGRFTYSSEDKHNDFVGASTDMPNFLTTWMNGLREEQVDHLCLKEGSLGMLRLIHQYQTYMGLQATAQAYLTDSSEMLMMNIDNNDIGNCYKVIMNGGANFDYEKNGNLENGTAYGFRLMKLEATAENE